MKNKILILGDARHGKDTLAELICNNSDFYFRSSSEAALEIFLKKVLEDKYGLKYKTTKEAYLDRVNHRDIWYNEIHNYNKEDKLKLCRAIFTYADIYVGMRHYKEVEQGLQEELFDYIIGIYDYRKPRESSESNTADVFKYSDFVIMNNGDLIDLEDKVFSIVLKVIL